LFTNKQIIRFKESYSPSPYAVLRPEILGKTPMERYLKDYNGQTYWLSVNISSFIKNSKVPKWLNIAFGYGAEGMITGNDELVNTIFLPESKRYRQFYLSLDVDLTKIETKSHFVKTILTIFNTIKIPAPAIEIKGCGGYKMHSFYF
jgi:hypothetical protein